MSAGMYDAMAACGIGLYISLLSFVHIIDIQCPPLQTMFFEHIYLSLSGKLALHVQ